MAHIQAVIQGEGDQLIFQRESLFQRFAEVGKRLLKLKIVIVIDGVLKYLAASKLYPLLEANTQQIMDYYDSTLENAIDHDNYLEFQQALSDLGEALEERFTLEVLA